MRKLLDSMKESFSEMNAALADSPVEGLQDWKRASHVPFGLRGLDRALTLDAGSFFLIAGRPGVGKTSLLLHVARTAASRGHDVLVVSPATRDHEIGERLVTAEARIDRNRMRSTVLGPKDWTALTTAASTLGGRRIWVDDTPYVTPEIIASLITQFVGESGDGEKVKLVLLDYVQLARVVPRRQNRYEELCDISFSLKCAARQSGVVIGAISQLNRSIDDRGRGAWPRLSDLRDSGTLEDEADSIIFVHPDSEPDEVVSESGESRNIVHLIIAKNRNGPTYMLRAALHAPSGLWSNVESKG